VAWLTRAIEPLKFTGNTAKSVGRVGDGFRRRRRRAVGIDPHGAFARSVGVECRSAPGLRKNGFLTRDSRMRERKKYGQKGARKRFQFSKR
jgi:hypothetical protein